MNRAPDLGWAAAGAAIALAGVGLFVRHLGAEARDEALVLVAAAGFAAVSAQLGAGLAQRPTLALSLPLLAGWWLATASGTGVGSVLVLASLGGALAGAVAGLLATGPERRAAVATLALALAAERLSDAFAADRLAASPAIEAALATLALAVAVLALGWWMQASLTAGLLHHGRRADVAATLGLRAAPRLATAGALGGVAGGMAGAVLAQAGAEPPTVATGLVLLVAALSGGGAVAVTFTLTTVFWLLPQLALRARPDIPDLAPWLAAGAAAVLLAGARRRARATAHG